MSDVSNKPLDKEGIIKRLTAKGFHLAKKPKFMPNDDAIKEWLSLAKDGKLGQDEIFNNIKNAASNDDDLLQGVLYTVNMSEVLKIPIPNLKKQAALLLLDQCRFTALDLADPDMCDLAQVYFKEINDKENWNLAHNTAQDAFPHIFDQAQELMETHNKIEAWKKLHLGTEVSHVDAKKLNELATKYLKQTMDLMDLFSMLDPMYCAKKIDEFFGKFKEFNKHFNDTIKKALKVFAESDPNFEDLRKVVEAI